jgi:hypothetical protein
MTGYELYPDYQDCYEYHGNTTIEITRKQNGITIKRDWILFDSIEEAQSFINDNCGDYGEYHVQ